MDDSAHSVHQQPYSVSLREREAIQTQVTEMLADGIIKPSTSSWSSSVVLAKNKDNTMRFCVDCRKLNSVAKKDVYPLPRIDNSLNYAGPNISLQ